MGWLLLPSLILALLLAILVLLVNRAEHRQMSNRLSTLARAKERGSHRARLQHPHVDLSRCIGCGTCIKACPEEGVLDLIHGQAVVIHGARCVGHGACAEACPVDAIDLTLGDLKTRKDIPVLTDELESRSSPGLFLAGEVTGYALIRTAISHGKTIADEVANRVRGNGNGSPTDGLLDFCIVGAGPAGVAASLQAKARGLKFVTLEQEALGGTVSKYPRRKLIMTQPVELPLYGRLERTSYGKEELMELWSDLASKYDLPIRTGEEFRGLKNSDAGEFIVKTNSGQHRARYVCLALGRRGTPRKLGVPGEELPKVTYSLIDARSYQDLRILVVGGGDSAVEAALGLAEQRGNDVTLSYRGSAFVRIKSRNEARLTEALEAGSLKCLLTSEVREIQPSSVRLQVRKDGETPIEHLLHNDEVFVMAGGTPPFKLLEECGVSLDPNDHVAPPPLVDRGTGLLKALWAALALAVMTSGWVIVFKDFYWAPRAVRPLSSMYEMLRPSSPFGLVCGVAAALLIVANLSYLLRRNWFQWIPGSLSAWMTSHVVTGILAMLLALIHAAMSPGQTVGGHAFGALCFLIVTGAIGRYFYSFVPRAANGNELAIEQVDRRLAAEAAEWDQFGRGFGDEARQEIRTLVAKGRAKGGFFLRLVAILRTQSVVQGKYRRLGQRGRRQGLSEEQVERLVALAERAYRSALASAHYEDLRALLNYWRFLHRWVALLMVLLAVMHVYLALRYGSILP